MLKRVVGGEVGHGRGECHRPMLPGEGVVGISKLEDWCDGGGSCGALG